MVLFSYLDGYVVHWSFETSNKLVCNEGDAQVNCSAPVSGRVGMYFSYIQDSSLEPRISIYFQYLTSLLLIQIAELYSLAIYDTKVDFITQFGFKMLKHTYSFLEIINKLVSLFFKGHAIIYHGLSFLSNFVVQFEHFLVNFKI